MRAPQPFAKRPATTHTPLFEAQENGRPVTNLQSRPSLPPPRSLIAPEPIARPLEAPCALEQSTVHKRSLPPFVRWVKSRSCVPTSFSFPVRSFSPLPFSHRLKRLGFMWSKTTRQASDIPLILALRPGYQVLCLTMTIIEFLFFHRR